MLTEEGLANIVGLVKVGRAICQQVLTWVVDETRRTIMKAHFVTIGFLATGRFVVSGAEWCCQPR